MKVFFFIFLTFCVTACKANFFSFKNIHETEAWGEIEVDISRYVPTCGFTISMLSKVALDAVEVTDYTVDAFYGTYVVMTSTKDNSNLAANPQRTKSQITLRGNFSNLPQNDYNVYIDWYCVCDEVSYPSCVSVDSDPATSPRPTGVSTTQAVEPTTAAATANVLLQAESSLFKRKEYLCYAGTNLQTMSPVHHLADCAVMCGTTALCQGINYWHNTDSCDLVFDDTSSNSAPLSTLSGCSHWSRETVG